MGHFDGDSTAGRTSCICGRAAEIHSRLGLSQSSTPGFFSLSHRDLRPRRLVARQTFRSVPNLIPKGEKSPVDVPRASCSAWSRSLPSMERGVKTCSLRLSPTNVDGEVADGEGDAVSGEDLGGL